MSPDLGCRIEQDGIGKRRNVLEQASDLAVPLPFFLMHPRLYLFPRPLECQLYTTTGTGCTLFPPVVESACALLILVLKSVHAPSTLGAVLQAGEPLSRALARLHRLLPALAVRREACLRGLR